MQNNLVTTFIEETFDNKCKNILLGGWCKSANQNQDLYKNSQIVEYHFDDSAKLENDNKYLCGLFYKILKKLTIHMNNLHHENKPERYWHIVLGPWLGAQISIAWDRWECLSKAFKEFDINETKCLKYNLNDLISSDFQEFNHEFGYNHRWNHILCLEIIKFNHSSKIKINFVEEEKVNFLKNTHIVNSYKKKIKLHYRLIDFLLKTIFRNPKIILYQSYFGFKNNVLIQLGLGEMHRFYAEFSKKIKMPPPTERENIKFNFDAENNFEEFLKVILFKLMPVAYLEGYKLLLSEIKKINFHPKVILTAGGHLSDDIFQIWAANQILKGTKFLISDHGGTWEKDEYFANFINISDSYFSWNQYNDKKCVQVPININLKKKKILRKNSSTAILIIGGSTKLYNLRIHHQPFCSQILQDYNLMKIFIENLSSEIKDNLIFRLLDQRHDIWNIRKKFEKDFDKKYISNKKIFKDDLNRSKILVNTSISTTLYESMKSGIPTIALFNRKILNMCPKLIKLRDLLVSNKIIFKSPLEASNHIEKIWNDPLEWWNSDKILQARELFSEHCSMETKNNLTYWKKILGNQMDKKL